MDGHRPTRPSPRRARRSAALLVGVAAAVLAVAPAHAQSGESLYELCVQCHGTAGEGNAEILAPAIAGLPAWYVLIQLKNYKQGIRGTHPEDVAGLRMYPMSLSLKTEAQMEAVSEYVATLPPANPEATLDGDAASGAGHYNAICATCHGANAEGNEVLSAPPLRHAADWYLLESLKKYKSGVRGYDPRYPLGAAMRGMAATMADEQAMKDVIAHILSLREE